ncbi:MAG: DUF2975 domain-containing protein [Propionibacteriaceae bacterium]|nr:DUF2975 domain-containing protein [Propionibacteriaceae bacterium]
MWTKDRSVTLSLWCTFAMIGLTILTGIFLPLTRSGFLVGNLPTALDHVTWFFAMYTDFWIWLLAIYYCFCIPALIALFATYKILHNIRRQVIFDAANVRLLRIISWASFAGGVICLAGIPISLTFGALGLICGFVGVILRVVKNLIAAATEIKAENDLTI